jgi:hypothetical protein
VALPPSQWQGHQVMNIFKNLLPENLYHTYVVHGDVESLAEELLVFLKDKKYIQESSPDTLSLKYESFTANDVSEIRNWHSQKSISDGKRICIISTKFINREAEQALLKILEEPAENTHFFIIIPGSVVLADTIVSRAHVVSAFLEKRNLKGEEFLKLIPKDRIDYIASLIKVHEGDDTSGGLRHDAIEIVNGLEQILHEKLQVDHKDKETVFKLEELQSARSYLSTPGASVKMILEHISLVL